ncbi:ion transporter [Nocardioides sp. KR10-350]|uniref:ion transporter n=1 Tax=Nocardioides cheoyonin TaxID=3156615 RepID=UPI0032B4CA7B
MSTPAPGDTVSPATPARPTDRTPGRALPPEVGYRAAAPGQVRHRPPVRRQPGLLSWLLALAALLSVAALLWMLFHEPADPWRDRLLGVDAAIAGLFLVEWCWRLVRARPRGRFLKASWWELVAMVPLLTPWVGDHAVPLVVVGVARVARLIEEGDVVFGDRVTEWLIAHFTDPIVETIKRPITIAVLDEVIDVIKTGTYAANVRNALDENHAELEAMVLELIREDQATGKLKYLPFHDDLVRLIADTVLRIVNGALDDPRTTELISDVIRNSATQLRQAIRDEET